MSYRQVQLRELMATRIGNVDPSKHLEECFELYSIPAFDVKKTEILFGKEIGSAKQNVQENDVLLSKIVPHIRRSWVVRKKSIYRQIASGEWIVFRGDKFFPDYLKHLVTSDDFHAKFMKTVSGVGGSLLRARPAQVAEISIPLPPLAEQQRIAAILDKAADVKAKREQAVTKLDELEQSVFVEMFGNFLANDKKWNQTTFKEKFKSVRYGTGSPPEYVENGVQFIRATNIKNGKIEKENLKFISVQSAEKIEKCKLKYGDVLIVRSGVNTGDCVMISKEFAGAYAAFDLILDMEPTEAEFYTFLLNTSDGKKLLEPLTRRAAQPHLNAAQISDLILIDPPKKLKEDFFEFRRLNDEKRRLASSGVIKSAKLIASLQHQAFKTGFTV